MSSVSIPLIRLLRRLFDLHIDQEDRDREKAGRPRRPRTMWEIAVKLLLAEFQFVGIGVPELREYLLRLRFAGIDPYAPLPTDGKTGKEFYAAIRAMPLGGVERTTPISTELARLDREGFGRELVEKLQVTHKEQIAAVLDVWADLKTSVRPDRAGKYNAKKRPSPNETTEQPIIDALFKLSAIGLEGLKALTPEARPTGERLAPKAIGRSVAIVPAAKSGGRSIRNAMRSAPVLDSPATESFTPLVQVRIAYKPDLPRRKGVVTAV